MYNSTIQYIFKRTAYSINYGSLSNSYYNTLTDELCILGELSSEAKGEGVQMVTEVYFTSIRSCDSLIVNYIW